MAEGEDIVDLAADAGSEGQSQEPVYRALREALMRGDVRPGERMVVKRISEQYGAGALPVRHALQRLVGEGALSDEPYRGARVPIRSVDELMDLRRVRSAIEGQAAAWAAQSVTGDDLHRLHGLQAQMNTVTETAQSEHYLNWNYQFHFTVYRAARSPLLVPMIERLWLRAGPYLNAMRTELTLGVGLDAHEMMLDALARGDSAAARHAVETEISEAAGFMVRALIADADREAAQ